MKWKNDSPLLNGQQAADDVCPFPLRASQLNAGNANCCAVQTTGSRPPLPPNSAAKRGHRRLSFGGTALAPAVPAPTPASARLPFKTMRTGGTPLDQLEKQVLGLGASAISNALVHDTEWGWAGQ
jgi:hypothetical protein